MGISTTGHQRHCPTTGDADMEKEVEEAMFFPIRRLYEFWFCFSFLRPALTDTSWRYARLERGRPPDLTIKEPPVWRFLYDTLAYTLGLLSCLFLRDFGTGYWGFALFWFLYVDGCVWGVGCMRDWCVYLLFDARAFSLPVSYPSVLLRDAVEAIWAPCLLASSTAVSTRFCYRGKAAAIWRYAWQRYLAYSSLGKMSCSIARSSARGARGTNKSSTSARFCEPYL